MLLPTQQTYGLAATSMMQSVLDGIEEQRRQEEEKRSGKERDPITEARISASEEAKRAREKITSALFGANRVDPNELKIELIDRLAGKLGIDPEEARSSYRLGKALEDALKSMLPNEVAELEKDLGLDEIDISIKTLLAAIKNPYGDDGQRLTDALTRKANGGKLDTEVERVVQRLEDVADSKTLEELKLGPQGYDPTRVEDEETRAERQQDIEAAEAGKKLEDVQDVQDIIEEKNNAEIEPGKDDAEGGADVDDASLLAVFAAAAEQAGNTDADEAGDNGAAELAKAASGDAASRDLPVTSETDAAMTELSADAIEELVTEKVIEDTAAILPITVDDIGIYELLKKKLAA